MIFLSFLLSFFHSFFPSFLLSFILSSFLPFFLSLFLPFLLLSSFPSPPTLRLDSNLEQVNVHLARGRHQVQIHGLGVDGVGMVDRHGRGQLGQHLAAQVHQVVAERLTDDFDV